MRLQYSPRCKHSYTGALSGGAIYNRSFNVLEPGGNTGRHECMHRNTTPCTDRILVQTRHTDAICARAACVPYYSRTDRQTDRQTDR